MVKYTSPCGRELHPIAIGFNIGFNLESGLFRVVLLLYNALGLDLIKERKVSKAPTPIVVLILLALAHKASVCA